MSFLPEEFSDFLKDDCRRGDFIQHYLTERGVKSVVTPLNGRNHILVQFDRQFYDSSKPVKTILAHYDRVSGSPGANDNSAAVWLLMQFAVELSKCSFRHNIRIFFTDGEELGEHGVQEQGAFGIARVFRKLNIVNDLIFVFDCCGVGDVAVLGQNVKPGNNSEFARRLGRLYDAAEKIMNSAGVPCVTLPCPYSDNASFLVNGIPAVAVTLLPRNEVVLYSNNGTIPETWGRFHTMADNEASLQPESFELMKRILHSMAAAAV